MNGAFHAVVAGWAMFATGLPHPVVNQIIAPLEPVALDVPAVVGVMREHASKFLVHLWHGAEPGVGRALREAGLEAGVERRFMTLTLDAGVAAADVPVPGGVRIERVADLAALAQHRAVDREAFDDPGVVAETFAPDAVLDVPYAGLFVAYLDGEPVATSVGVVDGDVVGVFGVATLERARRRGIGAAVTAAAVEFGRGRGCDLAYLQATDMGFSVYDRMGFETLGAYRGYKTPAA